MNCKECDKELLRKGLTYCSVTCQQLFERKTLVQEWLSGVNNGMRGKTSTAAWIKWHLINERGEKCERCGWNIRNVHTGNIPIELEHIDGDFTNNDIKNLELLCPNCHSLTKTYKGANKKGRPRSKYYRGT